MKFWNKICCEGLTHKSANGMAKNTIGYAITRSEWEGVHFYNKDGQYCILFADGHVEVDMFDKAWDKDKTDWAIVSFTEEALNILKKNNCL